MPFLDVSDVLADPDFADNALQVTRNALVVGTNGRGVVTPSTQQFSGVVTQADGQTFERFPEASRVSGSITITTTFHLRQGGADIDADIVTDAYGKRYTVIGKSDYSRYGAGFIIALCEPLGLS